MKSTKKILAILSVVALLATGAVTAFAGNVSDDPRPTSAFVDFSKAATNISGTGVQSYKGGSVQAAQAGRTVVAYDEDMQALRIDSGSYSGVHNIKPQIAFADKHVAYNDGNQVVNGYVVALMKLKNPATKPGIGDVAAGPSQHDAEMAGDKNTEGWSSSLPTTTYQGTTDWQLVVWDCTKLLGTEDAWTPAEENKPLEWCGVRLELFQWNAGCTPGTDVFWMKWCGVFSNLEDAYAYAGIPMASEEEEVKKTKPSGAFIDYSLPTPTGILGYVSDGAYKGCHTREYDAAEQAWKMTAYTDNLDNGTVNQAQYGQRAYTLSAKFTSPFQYVEGKYLYVGVMVKLGDTALTAFTPTVKGYIGTTWVNGTLVKGYENTTDWQLLIFKWNKTDATMASTAAYWNYMFISLNGEASTTLETYYHIKWAGVFDSVPAIYTYADMEIPVGADLGTTAGAFANFEGNNPIAVNGQTVSNQNSSPALVPDDGTVGGVTVLPANTTQGNKVTMSVAYTNGHANGRKNVATCPVFAAYVKPNTVNGNYQFEVYATTNGAQKTTTTPKAYDTTKDGWQLIWWDSNTDAWTATQTGAAEGTNPITSVNSGAQYHTVYMYLKHGALATDENDGVVVKWAGVFASVADAQAQAAIDDAVAANKAHMDALAEKEAAKAADKAAADPVKAAINALTVSPAAGADIKALRAQYAALTDTQKMLVGNSVLAAAEDQYNGYLPAQKNGAQLRSDNGGMRFGATVKAQDVNALDGWTLDGLGFVFCKKSAWDRLGNGAALERRQCGIGTHSG
ncbi:MAG: hypothetical protein IIW40_05980 [Clostridia bacterium]|nr:hypothetical protein [Clostridia bacterium]